jgi:hypothetical protein
MWFLRCSEIQGANNVSVRRLVFRSNKPKIATFRAEYAKHADFCDLRKNDMKFCICSHSY